MTGNVVKFPERSIKPETAACIAIVAGCNHDAAELFNLARITLNALDRMRPRLPEQGLVKRPDDRGPRARRDRRRHEIDRGRAGLAVACQGAPLLRAAHACRGAVSPRAAVTILVAGNPGLHEARGFMQIASSPTK
jgi:hypothetical protein